MNTHNDNHANRLDKPLFHGPTLSIRQISAKQLRQVDLRQINILKRHCWRLGNDSTIGQNDITENHLSRTEQAYDNYWLVSQGQQLIAMIQYHPLVAPNHVKARLKIDSTQVFTDRPYDQQLTIDKTSINNAYVGQLRQLMVAPAFQSQGIGQLLVQQVENRILDQAPYQRQQAFCLLHSRTSALGFYQQLGYLPMSNKAFQKLTLEHHQPLHGNCYGVHYQWLYRCLGSKTTQQTPSVVLQLRGIELNSTVIQHDAMAQQESGK